MITPVAEEFFRTKYANANPEVRLGSGIVWYRHRVRASCQSRDICVYCGRDGLCSPSACPRFGRARLEPQAMAGRGKSRTIGEVRRGFIEAAVMEQGNTSC